MSLPITTLWHASRFEIDRPTLAGRSAGANHANSGLGLFCATHPRDYLTGFGDHLLELTLRPGLRVMALTIDGLVRFDRAAGGGQDRSWFEAEGRRLAQDYDLIALVEIDGTVEQAIVLSDDAILTSTPLSLEAFNERVVAATPRRKAPGLG